MGRRARFLVAALALSGVRLLGLEWASDRFEGRPAPLQATLDVAFAFRNGSSRPVTLRSIQSNCDCLQVGASKTTLSPGESGVVTARFTVGDRIGLYERTITVVSDDTAEPKRLLVRIDVPEAAAATPNILEWRLGAAAEEKIVTVRVATGLKIDFREATPSNSGFRVRLETVEAGELYRLHISHAATHAAANAAIRVRGTASTGQTVLVSAYANVR